MLVLCIIEFCPMALCLWEVGNKIEVTNGNIRRYKMEYNQAISIAGLNKSQRKFCKAPITKNIRLLAPAGSGKTYSLLWRCKYIMSERQRKGQSEPNFLIVVK